MGEWVGAGLQTKIPRKVPFTSLRDYRSMFRVAIFIPLLGAACLAASGAPPAALTSILLGLNAASFPQLQRTPFDTAWSITTRRD